MENFIPIQSKLKDELDSNEHSVTKHCHCAIHKKFLTDTYTISGNYIEFWHLTYFQPEISIFFKQESVCESNASFDLTSFDIASCVEDCQQCIEILLQAEEEGNLLGEGNVIYVLLGFYFLSYFSILQFFELLKVR